MNQHGLLGRFAKPNVSQGIGFDCCALRSEQRVPLREKQPDTAVAITAIGWDPDTQDGPSMRLVGIFWKVPLMVTRSGLNPEDGQ